MRLFLSFITIIAAIALHPHLCAQEVTKEAPPSQATQTSLPSAPAPQSGIPLDLSALPHAQVIETGKPVQHVILESDTQSKHDDTYLLAGDVVITYGNRILRADTVTYNEATGDIDMQGHVRVSGGENDEYIEATHGTYNRDTQTGKFYDVTGSVGLNISTSADTFSNNNPVLFTGRMVVKTGPESYVVYDGSVTTCLRPHPDWELVSKRFNLNEKQAKAKNSTFKLLGVPLVFLPYVTHPADSQSRQSGLLIPVLSQSTTKGHVLGESAYVALGRSSDLTFGSEYYSSRGYSESATFRHRGAGDDFFNAHFSALQDRGYIDAATGLYINQGGEDVTTAFRRTLTQNTRLVGDAEYLSSYIYREAFTENFNQAVSSDITSIGYVTRQNNGYSTDVRADRYEGLKRVPLTSIDSAGQQVTTPGQEVKLFHTPSFDFDAVDHRIAGTPLLWDIASSVSGLKRVQPNFVSAGITERVDLKPELSLPLSGGGWHTMSSIAVRETFYSRSRQPQGTVPVETTSPLNRAAVDLNIDIRPPAIERTFAVPQSLQHLFGTEVRHTVEPELDYRNVRGVNNFLSVLRFDDNDLYSDTNELQYGVTQHLYFRPRPPSRPKAKPNCPAVAAAPPETSTTAPESGAALPENSSLDVLEPTADSSTDANGIPSASTQAAGSPTRSHARHHDPCAPVPESAPQQEWFSWRLAQKYFFDPTFGNAVVDTRRNIFDTTLAFSGIAFLTERRNISPLISRVRFRTSSHTDVEWDFDLDTGASRFTSSNIFLDAHEGQVFGGFSYARLNAPGRFYTENIDTNTLTGSATSNFSQARALLGYGTPTKPGLSVAGNIGLDLNLGGVQYISAQASYNWNCCGFSVEYRKYELGSVRNESVERFNFTLVNIGSAGNLRRAERLF